MIQENILYILRFFVGHGGFPYFCRLMTMIDDPKSSSLPARAWRAVLAGELYRICAVRQGRDV
jgi:hypothetical protein